MTATALLVRQHSRRRPTPAASRGKLFIQTHGCQMNEYDSAKMADVLAASDGLELTDNVDEADVDPGQHLLDPREGAGKGVQPARPLEGAEGRTASR